MGGGGGGGEGTPPKSPFFHLHPSLQTQRNAHHLAIDYCLCTGNVYKLLDHQIALYPAFEIIMLGHTNHRPLSNLNSLNHSVPHGGSDRFINSLE